FTDPDGRNKQVRSRVEIFAAVFHIYPLFLAPDIQVKVQPERPAAGRRIQRNFGNDKNKI
ncbi:MAG: hypothetical protein R3274_12580, partial [Desulfobacterales bacterium]|nr:hypothetical protein [Desulfobacterales bacterium]